MALRCLHPSTKVCLELACSPLGSHQFCSQVILSGIHIILSYLEVNHSVDKEI